MTDRPLKAWICTVCGYVHYGDEPPAECPVCGSPREMFEPYAEIAAAEATNPSPAHKTRRVVIIGAGVAGLSAAEALRGAAPDCEIILISAEAELPYYRLNLTRYLAGEVTAEQLVIHPQSWYAEHSVDLRLGLELTGLDLEHKVVQLSDGSSLSYDTLILTHGSHPFVPPIAGAELQHVTTLRTHPNADEILSASASGKKCVCIGGGLLGLETAGALTRRGVDVTVLETMSWLLPRQLNQRAAEIFQKMVEALGIHLLAGVKIQALEGETTVAVVLLADGTRLPADVVVISAGVRSNIEWVKQAGLTVNQGLVVDAAMRTSQTDVFAAGDLVEFEGMLYGTWGPAQLQGTVAGLNAGGKVAAFTRIPRSNILKVLGVDLFSIGQIAPQATEDVLVELSGANRYTGFVFKGSKMVGAILLGDSSAANRVKSAIENQVDFSAVLGSSAGVAEVLAFI